LADEGVEEAEERVEELTGWRSLSWPSKGRRSLNQLAEERVEELQLAEERVEELTGWRSLSWPSKGRRSLNQLAEERVEELQLAEDRSVFQSDTN
jgi:hypothetical protein